MQAIALLRQRLRRQRRDVSVALDVAEVTEAVTEAATGVVATGAANNAAARGRGIDAGAERQAAEGGVAGEEGGGRTVERRTCIVNRCVEGSQKGVTVLSPLSLLKSVKLWAWIGWQQYWTTCGFQLS